jgi:hypothetical protein
VRMERLELPAADRMLRNKRKNGVLILSKV